MVSSTSIFSLFLAKVTAYPCDEKYTTFRNIRKLATERNHEMVADLANIWGIFSCFPVFLAKGINEKQEGRFIPPKSAIN